MIQGGSRLGQRVTKRERELIIRDGRILAEQLA